MREGKFDKPDLYLESGDVLSLNATNRKVLVRAYGVTSDTWIGKQIELVLGQTMFQGAPQDSIIVNPVSPPLTAAEKAAAAGEPARDKMDDDIPFWRVSLTLCSRHGKCRLHAFLSDDRYAPKCQPGANSGTPCSAPRSPSPAAAMPCCR